jgi:GT2 family glycosyltransferase
LNRESAMARFVDVVRYHQYFDPAHMPAVIGANMAYRKAVLDQRGGFYNEFTHRGDETSLVRRLSAYCRSARAPAAIVYHERPSSWRRWLRTEFQEGYLMPLIAKAPTAQSRSREWLAWLEKLGVALAPIWLLLAVCSRAWCRLLGLVGAAVSMLGLARRHFFVGHYRQIRQRLRREYSFPLVGMVYVGVDWLMTAARTCGWLYGLWTYRRASLSLAFPSGASIERLLTNQPNKTES